jgi:glycosyltransferase involved in cell wall biosynthesis
VFFAFRDAPERRTALRTPRSLDRYRLFGLDEIVERGGLVRHNLERQASPVWAKLAGRTANSALDVLGGIGGDFASMLASRAAANDAAVVFSTVDTVGIPLLLLKRAGLVRPPLVYASIGLPERLARLRNEPMRRLFKTALGSARTVIAYSVAEVEQLREWISDVVFVPFGVDTEAFRPAPEVRTTIDVLSVGADPLRDFELLLGIASRRREWIFHIVTTAERAHALEPTSTNVVFETGVTLETVRDRLAQARVVALPVHDNTYSGATTTLLQAMAMAKPVVVSRTGAIAEGYGLADGVNGRFVVPGSGEEFERALGELLANETEAGALGARARETVERSFTWERYADTLWTILSSAGERRGAGV